MAPTRTRSPAGYIAPLVELDPPLASTPSSAGRSRGGGDARPEGPGGARADRADELAEIIGAYNAVTDRLRQSHETLSGEVARLQRELASANAALQRSRRLAALGEMAAGIAHEIRNPLGSIQLYADMLAEDLADQPAPLDLARKIAEAVRGLNAIVGDVLSFSREIRLAPADGSAHDLFRRTVAAMTPTLDEAHAVARIAGDDPGFRADFDLLHQAMVNLVRNACEAMGEAGVVTLAARRADAAVELIVRDTGPGIDAEQVDRIFNPFFTTRATGTGLGLAIVHRIVDAHGGAIAVHNDGGAVFTLTLPLDAPASASASAPAPADAAADPAEHSLPHKLGGNLTEGAP